MPVLPAVPSTTVPPGANCPLRSGRGNNSARPPCSFTEPPRIHELGFAEDLAAGLNR